ncbi:PIN-like domain-containing protein [Glaciihabitans sp. UYNi722]|uniref:PIN-like domain-containing protein n=1 Tax=Glaciihabitans sp. UYNi722 TaxID=3156344 RepID=UPI00339662C3
MDANVLLNVLRYTPSARKELLRVLAEVAERCFVPHQIAVEYNRNRVKVVADRHKELQDIAEEVAGIKRSVRTVVNGFKNRSTLRSKDVPALEESVTDFLAALENAYEDALQQYDLEPDRLVGTIDEWTANLDVILTGHVAARPSAELLEADVLEAEKRHNESIAPGFKDQNKGDYLWWAETLRHPGLRGRALLVISDDTAKGDWVLEERGIGVGPHPVLIEDVMSAGGTDLVLLTTRDLLQLVGEVDPQRGVSGDTLDESEKVLASRNVEWDEAAYKWLLTQLSIEGYDDRVEAITTAATADGFVDREEIYRILGSDEDARSLRHFATPVLRLKKLLVRDGMLSPASAEALSAVYDGPGKTIGYQVPAEFQGFSNHFEPDPDDMPGGKDWS